MFGIKDNAVDFYHQYYDVDIVNYDTSGTNAPVRLALSEVRNSQILIHPENYFFSIVRFRTSTGCLPLMIPEVEIGSDDINKLAYSITLAYRLTTGETLEYKQNLIYVPQNLTAPLPPPPLTSQNVTSEYYYIYNFQYFIVLVNQAFINAFNGLKALVIAAGESLPSNIPPFMEWDPIDCLAILDCDILGYGDNLVSPILIYFNSSMFNLFQSFQAFNLGYNVTNGKNYQIMVYNNNNTNILNQQGGTNLIQMFQDYSTSSLWNPVSSIVFTTSMIPILSQLVGLPKIYNSDTQLISSGNNSNISNTLTDFVIDLVKGTESKPNVVYTPSGAYRLIDMTGGGAQSFASIQISAYWKDKFGNLHEMTLRSGDSCSIKLMFRLKELGV